MSGSPTHLHAMNHNTDARYSEDHLVVIVMTTFSYLCRPSRAGWGQDPDFPRKVLVANTQECRYVAAGRPQGHLWLVCGRIISHLGGWGVGVGEGHPSRAKVTWVRQELPGRQAIRLPT